jgi:dipeptidyl aminopeptidase/acylaminoacyl peptidase
MFLIPLLLTTSKPSFHLSVDSIMQPGLVGEAPSQYRWSPDSKTLSFNWASPADKVPGQYEVDADGTKIRPVDDSEPPSFGGVGRQSNMTSPDGKWIALVSGTEIQIKEGVAGKAKRVSKSDDPKFNVEWTTDGRHLTYSSGQREMLLSIDDGTTTELASVKAATTSNPFSNGAAPPAGTVDEESSPSRQALSEEERALFPQVQGRGGGGFGGRGGGRRGRFGGAATGGPPGEHPIVLKPGQTAFGFIASPDGEHTAIPVGETASRGKSTFVPNYITPSGYTEEINSYQKVGDIPTATMTLALTSPGGKTVWLSPPASVGKRSYAVRNTSWSGDGTTLVGQIATDDHKDLWLAKIDPTTGVSTPLFTEHSDAWLGGPGRGTFGWLPDHKRIYFESENDGWAHLYTCDVTTGTVNQLTHGPFEVSAVRLSKDGSKFYFVSSEGSTARRHFDSISVDGGATTRLCPPGSDDTLDGDNPVALSPDETHAAYLRSWSNHPPELFIANFATGKETKLTESPSAEFASYPWIKPELVMVPATDGAKVPGHLYLPAHFKKGGPAVLFVHGAGYLQNVHDWWSTTYYREYMFNNFLASKGVAVLDIDYRASAGYGRDWRTAVYRFMGGRDLDDEVDAAHFLTAKYGVDPKRIGMYGGSYGGFMTLMAMFTKPGVFAAGAALRPVSDWANYNDGYTSEILNLPQDDKVAYRRSSPIFHAEGLQGALLICHGLVDTNVHFQDTVRLVQRLVDLKKENWSVQFYPIEDHAFTHPTSWIDEYKRIYNLFQTNLHFRG